MFRRVLVPLDGSGRAERAIPVAARIARSSGGSVVLLRVVSTSIEYWPYMAPQPTLAQTVIDADLEDAAKYLASVTALSELNGLSTETMTLYGPTAATILSVAYSHDVDVIVMCSHGYTGVTRWIMGSVAEKIARHSAVPVLILREGGPIPAGPHVDGRPFRVLVPLDGSMRAKAAIEPAAALVSELAAPGQGALHLMRVVKPHAEEVGLTQEQHEREPEQGVQKARKYLSSIVEHIHEGLTARSVKELNLAVTWSVAVDSDVASAIIRVGENGEDVKGVGVFGGCDVVAIATHGYGGLQRWAMGSVTERVLNAAKLPMLIVRPSDMMDKTPLQEGKSAVAMPG
ncbi:MAG TPA: universal stress protein [Ktedonobacteraceae bacterium]|nr:universal stress protein [Ktedonobacteraceae bacterium]